MNNSRKLQIKNIKNIFLKALELNISSLKVHEYIVKSYPKNSNVYIVAIGKAASSMLEGAISALDEKFIEAILITKNNPDSDLLLNNSNIRIHISGHPIPTKNSLTAGKYLIEFLQQVAYNDQILFLISGGTSSLVEYFSKDSLISITDLKKLYTWLLGSDKNIMEVNQIRKQVSGIKSGKLLDYIKCNNLTALYISDIPDDSLNNIGSGLLMTEQLTKNIPDLPNWIDDLINRAKTVSDISVGADNIEKKITSKLIFSNTQLRNSIVELSNSITQNVVNMDEFLVGNTVEEAQRISDWLKNQISGVYIWGAETHMMLPESPGRGGRNQSFALALAMNIQKYPNILVLVAGTDGNDGNTDAAGAIVDGGTIGRGELQNLSANTCLKNANAGEFLLASGDLLTIGLTGTNVMDIIIALIGD